MSDFSDPIHWFPDVPPRRVVSLVPSSTGSLIDLGFSDTLVGITDFCPAPVRRNGQPVRLGGPKDFRCDDVLGLRPDLIIASQEENSRSAVEELIRAGARVWLSFPKTVRAAVDDLYTLVGIFHDERAMAQVRGLEDSLEWARRAAEESPEIRYFCPIWQDRTETGERWWMTFNSETYSNSVFDIYHLKNCFAGRKRRYPFLAELGHSQPEEPGDRDTRYPRVGWKEIIAAQPELIILPNEPYPYHSNDLAEIAAVFADTPAGKAGRIVHMDGSLIHWPGTQLARALSTIPSILTELS